jgi:propionyl-CoA carboxylase alpha chain
MFKKILIANRGEIACRIIDTAGRLGIATVAVYSEADAGALHTRMADEAVAIGPAPAAKSYLNGAAIIRAARKTGADAVHPGYGFLAENADFARAVAKAHIVFIGPGPAAIATMGDKIKSKKLAQKVGVPVIPGGANAAGNEAQAARDALAIGYPVMIKASAGGGGKGMRIAHDEGELKAEFAAAVREALTSFGDGRVFVEKFIENPRHIEIQVLADEHGNVIHLGERECSIQRRHQKIIEEAPSPLPDGKTRKAMGAQAVALARAVNYISAGTVEFIVDAERNFYFLEMNTRLQVEHPVTEMISGLDIVEAMIRIAAGEALPLTQGKVKAKGWAVEARIYAEDPGAGFLPSAGRLVRYLPPPEDDHLRLDSGVEEGSDIPVHYDPMMAKLIAWGPDREAAIARLGRALDAFVIRGVAHNVGFLANLLAHPRFIEGRLSTSFIDDEYQGGFDPQADPREFVPVAAAVHQVLHDRALGGRGPGDWVVRLGGENHAAAVRPLKGGFEVTTRDGKRKISTDWMPGQPLFRALIDGTETCVQVERLNVGYRLSRGGALARVLVLDKRSAELVARMPGRVAPDTSRLVLSPMPGLLSQVGAEAGRAVKAGDTLAIVEAMKMENAILAERGGIIAAVHARPGDSLAAGQVIMEFE